MNKLSYLILLTFLILSCVGKHRSDAPPVTINSTSNQPSISNADTININHTASSINWTATEMRGIKKRTGKISFMGGYLLIVKKEIVGGNFMVDMETMDITDIPAHELTARKNLIAHLKSADFFYTEKYPTSTLKLTHIEKLTDDSLRIRGDFTIRDVTKNITFLAERKGNRIATKFTFNRLDWKVAYTGSWADKTLVDNDIELAIELVPSSQF